MCGLAKSLICGINFRTVSLRSINAENSPIISLSSNCMEHSSTIMGRTTLGFIIYDTPLVFFCPFSYFFARRSQFSDHHSFPISMTNLRSGRENVFESEFSKTVKELFKFHAQPISSKVFFYVRHFRPRKVELSVSTLKGRF